MVVLKVSRLCYNIGAATVVSVFNPSREALAANVTVPMYYSGLAHGSRAAAKLEAVSTGRGGGTEHAVGREGGGMYDIRLPVSVPPASYAIFTIEAA